MAQEIPGAHVVGDFGQKALIVKDGKVLMCKVAGYPIWDFPGGRLHVEENLTDGLMREVKEELGVDVEVGDPFYVTVWYGAKSGMPRILVLYVATLADPNAPINLAKDELESVMWVGKDDIENIGVAEVWKPALYKFFAVQSFARKPFVDK